jgi:DNA-binding transcriptional regulator YiaG
VVQARRSVGLVSITATDLEQIAWVRAALASGEARRIREDHHLHQAEASRAIGASLNTVHRWEAGVRSPRGELAIRYGRLLRRLEAAG